MADENKHLIVFQDKKIRRVLHNEEWYFSVVDVVEALEASALPKRYWSDLKAKLVEEGFEPYDKIVQLKLPAEDGKLRETDCANTKNMFRIIQSVPSKKAEPFKQWLAKVGYERVQEIENPELAQQRAKEYYELKGYPKDWIEKRLRGIAIRQELTDEWKNRDVGDAIAYSILTNEIAKATFGVSIKEHKQIKGLEPQFQNQNLRDHMTDLELIFTMLGEKATTEITKAKDSQGYDECLTSSKEGGTIARDARVALEKKTGKKVVSGNTFLHLEGKEQKKIEKK
ncbi:Bro-N domain-containing protein [Candidatus Woesearchaeota archaeon]|nr:Bro-N domain-containing protein [Candidatus Woesearchaeota archaeon]